MERFDIINRFISERFGNECRYLEIGVRTHECFRMINTVNKSSVDPEKGYNPTYNFTSDEFFHNLESSRTVLPPDYKWNIIFIDGLHIAEQSYRDILNSINHTTDDGVVILHDCSPNSQQNAGSDLDDLPYFWSGSVWKSFYFARTKLEYQMYTVDTDWGVGIIDKKHRSVPIEHTNVFFDYGKMKHDRVNQLGLIGVDEFIMRNIS